MIFGLVVVVIGLWQVARRRRRSVLAGRVSARPTYMVEPPQRRQEKASRGRL